VLPLYGASEFTTLQLFVLAYAEKGNFTQLLPPVLQGLEKNILYQYYWYYIYGIKLLLGSSVLYIDCNNLLLDVKYCNDFHW
jgi:hypothetical protein